MEPNDTVAGQLNFMWTDLGVTRTFLQIARRQIAEGHDAAPLKQKVRDACSVLTTFLHTYGHHFPAAEREKIEVVLRSIESDANQL